MHFAIRAILGVYFDKKMTFNKRSRSLQRLDADFH